MLDRFLTRPTATQQIEKLIENVMGGVGESSTTLRRQVSEYAADNSIDHEGISALPADLRTYLDKVKHHAYRITDADIQRVKNAGYAEDELFELTISAALGASHARWTHGMAALATAEEKGTGS